MAHPLASLLAPDSALDRVLAFFGLKLADIGHTGARIVAIWIVAWLGWQLVKWIARRVKAVADHHNAGELTLREKRAQTVGQLLLDVGRGTLLVVAMLLTLNEFINVTPLLGGAAVLGLAVSFGAQSLVKDFLAGFFILMENQFVVGDRIEAAGRAGVVERLTLRTVSIRDLEGTLHVIPNGQITILSNRTRGWSRAVVDIAVGYGNDVDRVIAEMSKVATDLSKDADWNQLFDGPPEVLGVDSLRDTGMVVRTLLRTRPGVQQQVAREYRRRALHALERAGILGPAPSPAPAPARDPAEQAPPADNPLGMA